MDTSFHVGFGQVYWNGADAALADDGRRRQHGHIIGLFDELEQEVHVVDFRFDFEGDVIAFDHLLKSVASLQAYRGQCQSIFLQFFQRHFRLAGQWVKLIDYCRSVRMKQDLAVDAVVGL